MDEGLQAFFLTGANRHMNQSAPTLRRNSSVSPAFGEGEEPADAGFSPVRAEVHVFVGAEPLAIYSIQPGVYLLGQDDSCHLHIAADRVAGMHARLTLQGHRLLVEDLEDTGGIFIGGLRVRLPTPVYQNTEIHIGSARIFFRFDAETRARMAQEIEDPSLGLDGIRRELLQEAHQLNSWPGRDGTGPGGPGFADPPFRGDESFAAGQRVCGG